MIEWVAQCSKSLDSIVASLFENKHNCIATRSTIICMHCCLSLTLPLSLFLPSTLILSYSCVCLGNWKVCAVSKSRSRWFSLTLGRLISCWHCQSGTSFERKSWEVKGKKREEASNSHGAPKEYCHIHFSHPTRKRK